mmetsp:Transcript_112969/g.196110  ORF Transcript_112969/g.196110 Transcript_112969/m.196110 type:complete len:227 (-) Transcript_112969:545-1225(-)
MFARPHDHDQPEPISATFLEEPMDWAKPVSGGPFLEIVEEVVVEQPDPKVDSGIVEAVDMYWEHIAEEQRQLNTCRAIGPLMDPDGMPQCTGEGNTSFEPVSLGEELVDFPTSLSASSLETDVTLGQEWEVLRDRSMSHDEDFANVLSPVEPPNEAMAIATGEGQPGTLIKVDEDKGLRWDTQLKKLDEMGFEDRKAAIALLDTHGGNMLRVVEAIISMVDQGHQG